MTFTPMINKIIKAGLVLLPLLIGVVIMIYNREYDLSQYSMNKSSEVHPDNFKEIDSVGIVQSFESESNLLVGMDIIFAGEKNLTNWEISEFGGEIISKGQVQHSGEGRVSRIRFDEIPDSRDKLYALKLYCADNCDVEISYTVFSACDVCSLKVIDSEEISNGVINFTPVYKSKSIFEYIQIINNRILRNLVLAEDTEQFAQ